MPPTELLISAFLVVNHYILPKTVSARIENDVHQKLIEKCNKLGCRVSDYAKASIEFMLYGETEFDFGQEEEEVPAAT